MLRWISVLFVFATAQFAQANEPIDTTVTSIILERKPNISYQSQEFRYLFADIKKQVQALMNNHIKQEVRGQFQQALPFSAGRILLKVNNGIDLKPVRSNAGDLTTSITAVNALITKYQITEFKPFFSEGSYLVTFKANENPRVVAKKLAELNDIEYAEIDSMIGGKTAYLSKLSHVLYSINLGWGDCPSGCINQSRTYVEVYNDGTTALIGRGGDAMSSEMLNKIFVK